MASHHRATTVVSSTKSTLRSRHRSAQPRDPDPGSGGSDCRTALPGRHIPASHTSIRRSGRRQRRGQGDSHARQYRRGLHAGEPQALELDQGVLLLRGHRHRKCARSTATDGLAFKWPLHNLSISRTLSLHLAEDESGLLSPVRQAPVCRSARRFAGRADSRSSSFRQDNARSDHLRTEQSNLGRQWTRMGKHLGRSGLRVFQL